VNKSVVFLSHVLSENSPCYGGKKGFIQTVLSSISNGDSYNFEKWELANHVGTHMDTPFHFIEDGIKLDQIEAIDLLFYSVSFIETDLSRGEIVRPDHLEGRISEDNDMVLIKSGFEKYRNDAIYWQNNPGISPEVADFLKHSFPKIKIIGFDFISLTSYSNRALGRESHKAFLGGNNPIMIIEDMHLENLNHAPREVIVAPIRVTNSDAAPVTVFAYL